MPALKSWQWAAYRPQIRLRPPSKRPPKICSVCQYESPTSLQLRDDGTVRRVCLRCLDTGKAPVFRCPF